MIAWRVVWAVTQPMGYTVGPGKGCAGGWACARLVSWLARNRQRGCGTGHGKREATKLEHARLPA
jgi:hypothetical protein